MKNRSIIYRVLPQHLISSDIVQTVLAFAIKVAAGAGSYLLFVILARVMGADEFGLFSIVFSIVMLMGNVGSFGQQTFLVKQIPKERVGDNKEKELGVYYFSAVSTVIGAFFASGLFVLIAMYMPKSLSFLSVLGGAMLCFLLVVAQTTVGALRIQNSTLLGIFTRDLVWRVLVVVGVAVNVWFVSNGFQAGMALTIMAMMLLPIVLLHLFVIYRHLRQRFHRVRPLLCIKSWFETSCGLGFITILGNADVYLYTIILGYLLSPEETGAFFASLKTIEVLNLFFLAVTLIVSPKISELISKGDKVLLQRQCNSCMVLQGIPAILAAVFVFVLAPFLLKLFNVEYVQYAGLLRLLMVGTLVNALSGATGLIMQLSGMHWRQSAYLGGCLLFSLIILPFLIPALGVFGAAVSFILTKVLWNVLAVIVIRKRVGIDPSLFGLFVKKSGGIRAAFWDLVPQSLKKQEL